MIKFTLPFRLLNDLLFKRSRESPKYKAPLFFSNTLEVLLGNLFFFHNLSCSL